MKTYKLIKTYPGSPPINSIFKESEKYPSLLVSEDEMSYLVKYYITDHPEFWEQLERLNHTKKPLFTTEDGVDLFNLNDKCFWLRLKDNEIGIQPFVHSNLKTHTMFKYFSTKEKVQEYLNSLKPKVEEKKPELKCSQLVNRIWNNGEKSLGKLCVLTRESKPDFKSKNKPTHFYALESFNKYGRVNKNETYGLGEPYYKYELAESKDEPVKQETVSTSIYNKIISFRNNTGTGANYTYNKNTDKYHSNKSIAQVPFDECMKRYPILRVINTERNILVVGNMVCRTDVDSKIKYKILEFGKKKNNLFAKLKSCYGAIRYVDIDNLEHCV